MKITEEKREPEARRQLKGILGFEDEDEQQVWLGNIWYHYIKSGKAWKCIGSRTYSDAEIKAWDHGFSGETLRAQRRRCANDK